MHVDGHNPVPFTVNKNRRLFALKCLAYMGTGFSIPFIAIWWHWCVYPTQLH
ncbi:hypothetical protein BJ165DRAFT_1510681 [Panaeolus papilionaceus]|nr:hypothetical protein BJ165DRAFT_1510681 [Panaeolus papilionaceus]